MDGKRSLSDDEVDGAVDALLTSFGLPDEGIAVDDTGMRAFVTDEGGTGVFVIDVERRAISREIRVGAQPNGIVFLQR